MTIRDPIVVAGIDAGKSELDAHILKGGLERRFNNDKCGRCALCNWLLKHGVTRTVFEPTGRYHRNLHQCLFDAGIETVLVNPLCSRRFALVAVMRKLASLLNILLREDRLWQAEPPIRQLEAAA